VLAKRLIASVQYEVRIISKETNCFCAYEVRIINKETNCNDFLRQNLVTSNTE